MMPTEGWTIGSLGGVEIKLNPESLAHRVFGDIFVGKRGAAVSRAESGLVGILGDGTVRVGDFIGSILWHEMAHVIMAQRFGIPVMQVVLHLYGGVALLSREPERPSHEFLDHDCGAAI